MFNLERLIAVQGTVMRPANPYCFHFFPNVQPTSVVKDRLMEQRVLVPKGNRVYVEMSTERVNFIPTT